MTGGEMHWLDVIGNIAATATAIVASFGYLHYRYDQRRKRLKLESYLKTRKQSEKTWQHSILHLTAKLSMSEAEILNASFASPNIRRLIAMDNETGLASQLLLEYAEEPEISN
ncbi:MAG: hypothetical protein KDJ37_14500 [Hyphomicrobiaceae bacterium]|nr:hypothetical protein [Hyphomicrobiaceae bacterium]